MMMIVIRIRIMIIMMMIMIIMMMRIIIIMLYTAYYVQYNVYKGDKPQHRKRTQTQQQHEQKAPAGCKD